MKKIVTIVTLLILTTAVFAQKGKVTSALSYKESGNLEKAWETIESASDPENEKAEKSLDWPRTWQVRGEILQDIYRLQKTGLVEEPLFKAYDAYMKAIELDDKGKFAKSIVVDLTFLQTDFSNYAVKTYEAEKYDVALACFEKFMAISNNPLINTTGQEVVDTAIIYNAGLTAFKAENWDKSVEYFLKSAKLDYNGDYSFYYAFKAYQAKEDSVKAIQTLQEGFEAYPENEVLIVELINHFINAKRPEDAIKYLDLAIEKDPTNFSLYTAKGSALEKIGRQEDAVELYKQAIEKDQTQFTPYYNLGVIYYNKASNLLNEANQLPPSATKEYDAKVAEGSEFLKLALPYMEKAYELDDSEIAVLESLKTIYYRLQMNDKYNEVNKKLQSVKK